MSGWRDVPEIDHCLLLVCLTELLFSPILFIYSRTFSHIINFAGIFDTETLLDAACVY